MCMDVFEFDIFPGLGGSKMLDFGTVFLDLGTILVPKTYPKRKALGLCFRTLCEYAKSVILNDPLSFLLYFIVLKALFFQLLV